MNKKRIAIIAGVILTAILVVIGIYTQKHKDDNRVSYNAFLSELEADQIEQVTLSSGSSLQFNLKDNKTVYITDYRNE